MEFKFNIDPQVLSRIAEALEGIDASLKTLLPSPMAQDEPPASRAPSGEDAMMIYSDEDAAQDYQKRAREGRLTPDEQAMEEELEGYSQPLAYIEADLDAGEEASE